MHCKAPRSQDPAHPTAMRSEGSGWSIWGRRALNVFACGIRRPSMVLRTLLRPPGRLRMDLRSSMASEAWGKMGRGQLLAFPQLEENWAPAPGGELCQAPGGAVRGAG